MWKCMQIFIRGRGPVSHKAGDEKCNRVCRTGIAQERLISTCAHWCKGESSLLLIKQNRLVALKWFNLSDVSVLISILYLVTSRSYLATLPESRVSCTLPLFRQQQPLCNVLLPPWRFRSTKTTREACYDWGSSLAKTVSVWRGFLT